MSRIFLTGATGFVGSFVARHLITENHHVTCLIRPTSSLQRIADLPLQLCTGSLFNKESFVRYLQESDFVIHVAGTTKAKNYETYTRGNVETTRQLLLAINALKISLKRFVLISSQAAVGPSPSPEPIDEEFPCHPVTQYGKSKLHSEEVARSFMDRIPVTIIRPPVVYGPGDQDVLKLFKTLKLGFNVMIGGVDQLVSLVYAEDLAAGIVMATFVPQTVGKTYFLGDETPYHWSEVAGMSGKIMNKKYFNLRLPYVLVYGLSWFLEIFATISGKNTIINPDKMNELKQPYWVISSGRARNDFSFKTQYDLQTGLEKTIKWYHDNNWL
jgi:dihydroflavonol-4-reductase